MEGAHFVSSGELLSFSEQQLLDCSTLGNAGCNGGSPNYAYFYYKSKAAILESDYPYTSGGGKTKG